MIRSLTPPAHVTKSEVVKQAHILYTERLFFSYDPFLLPFLLGKKKKVVHIPTW